MRLRTSGWRTATCELARVGGKINTTMLLQEHPMTLVTAASVDVAMPNTLSEASWRATTTSTSV